MRHSIHATADVVEGDVMRPSRLILAFPSLKWSADCDRLSMTVTLDQWQRQYPWCALDPEHILLDVGIVNRGFYAEREVIMCVAFNKNPPWNECPAPGLFVMWLWNACTHANKPPPTARPRKPRNDY